MDFTTASQLVTSADATAQDLTDICNAFPELRASVAVHPNAHPQLLNWLAQLGDPAVNAALAARAARQQPAPQEKGGGSGWVWIIVVILLALVGFLVWRAVTPDDVDPEPTPTETQAETPSEETDEPTDETQAPTTEEETDDPTEESLGTIGELFADAALAQCVADALQLATTDTVTQEELDVIGTQDVEESNLYWAEQGIPIVLTGGSLSCDPGDADTFSLEGIQHLTTLSSLQIGLDSTIDLLDVTPLASLEQLVFLSVTNNLEEPLRVAPIADLPNLEGFGFARIGQESLEDLVQLEKLTFVAVASTSGIDDFGFVLEIPALEVVGVGQHGGTLPEEIAVELEGRGISLITLGE